MKIPTFVTRLALCDLVILAPFILFVVTVIMSVYRLEKQVTDFIIFIFSASDYSW